MATPLDVAARTVASACAINTTFVKIISTDPLQTAPKNLFLIPFKAIGVIGQPNLAAFLATLSGLLPIQLRQDIVSMPINADVQIGLVVDHVEALLVKLAAGGFN